MIPAVALTVVGVAIIGRQLETNPENKDVLDKRRLWIGLAAGVSTAFTWSISTFLLDALLDTINLFLIAVMRLTFATAIMTPFILGRQVVWGHPSLTQRHWIYLSIGGTIALAIGYVGFALSLQLVDITSATVLSSLTPLFALVIGWRSLKERVNLWTVTGVVTCVTGIILIAIAVSLA